jgi:TetR/AcrR family transcriptional regulator, transcriptional repressor for nem operon
VEAFRYALANVVRTRTENIEQIDSTVERLRYLIRRFVESPSMMPGGCPLMNTAIDNDDGNPALRQLALEGIQAWKARLVAIVDAGIERGEIRGEIEPRRIANTIVAALEGALMMSRLEDNKAALKDVAESLEVVLDGIASR